jgi:arylsulfatase A-like enzyme
MLVVDSLRRDYAYGPKTKTPTLDGLIDEGTRFDQAISSATWTPPCMGSIFSGIYPHRLGMYDFSTPFPDDLQTLFDYFVKNGLEVGSFVFDENYLFSEVPSANVVDNFRDYKKPKDWIHDHVEDDFFLFVHHYWVHGPYEPQPSAEAWSKKNEEIRRELRENHADAIHTYREKYANAVERMSECWLDGILGTLRSAELLEDTIIVFLGDHGESWGERYEDPSVVTKNFHMHGKLLYDELIRVPLVIRYPQEVPEGLRVTEQVRQVDIFPTILEMAGIEIGDGWDRDGRSLVRAFNGGIDSRRAIASATDADIETIDKMSIRYPDEKLIWTVSTDRLELFDLERDPDETSNLAEERPERAEDLRERLATELNRAPNGRGVDDETRERLEELGYL